MSNDAASDSTKPFPELKQKSDGSSAEPNGEKKKKSYIGWIVMLVILVGGGLYGFHLYQESLTKEVTDNAQIDGNVVPVSARVRGQVLAVKVGDNDVVKKGDLLFIIDSRDYENKVAQAESALASARNRLSQAKLQVALTEATTSAQVQEQESSITVSQQQVLSATQAIEVARAEASRSESDIAKAQAQIAQAAADQKRAAAEVSKAESEAMRLRNDRARYKELFSKREVSEQQYEAAVTASQQADAQVEVARQQLSATQAMRGSAEAGLSNAQAGQRVAQENIGRAQTLRGETVAKVGEARGRYREATAGTLQSTVARAAVEGAQTEVQAAETSLKQAQLDLSYTKTYAASDGRVTRKNIEVGQHMEVGTPALALVDEKDVWVTANFKETQMEKMTVGQAVTIDVDTYPNAPLKGKIASIQAGTGSVFSLLPPENASGSFVKVVQRIPVKIVIDAGEQGKVPLRPGMSVEATVWLR